MSDTILKIATWNVNSIKARYDHVRRWLAEHQPDVLFLQELKTETPPDFMDVGYHTEAVAQKAYNGTAILSRQPITVIHTALPGDDTDTQARYLEVDHDGLRLISIYLPNGNPVDTEKFNYKLGWMQRLAARVQDLIAEDIPFLIGGDYNIITDARDCEDPAAWANDALFRIESRKAFRTLLHMGLTDAFRVFHDGPKAYTFWDYQGRSWERDNGIRIDTFLTSPHITDRLIACTIDRDPRGWERPSDHVPVVMSISASMA